MGLLDKIIPKSMVSKIAGISDRQSVQGFQTFTEYSPRFSSFDGSLYEQAQTRAIVECIATACSKLKPEFVTPEGSGGALPRIQRLVCSWPNEMQSWPEFIKLVIGRYLVYTTTYIVPAYDPRDGSVIALYSMNPSYAEVVEYKNEPWIRFHLKTGDVQVFPFYDVAILTRFQLDSDIFGGGNTPLTPTLRLMEAQRQAEEIALKTGADIRFIGKMTQVMHDEDLAAKRKQFADNNLNPSKNTYGLLLYDRSFDSIEQINPQHFTISSDEMERIDKILYSYFTINENVLNGSCNEQEWGSWYEACIEPKAILLGNALSMMLLTPTQVRKGNRLMFSSSYLEYATSDSKIKVVSNLLDRGVLNFNQALDVFQMPNISGGNVRMLRGEYYLIDENNQILAESGGKAGHSTDYEDDFSNLDEPPDNFDGTDDSVKSRKLDNVPVV